MKKYWKSTNHLKNSSAFSKQSKREFPTDKADKFEVNRRDFFKTMGASLAMAGISGCSNIRKPKRKIYPYVKRPENLIPGKPIYYATSHSVGDNVSGLLVESLGGRPTKVEGNPFHPLNKGASSVWDQASVLNLYNPDRLSSISFNQKPSNVGDFKKWISNLSLSSNSGSEVGVLLDYVPSPTIFALIEKLKVAYPNISFYNYSPVNNDNVYQGIKDMSGSPSYPVVDFSKADVIISLDSDFLGVETNSLANSREFMKRRKAENGPMNRLYQFESSFSITGGVADHRFKVKRSDIEILAYEILRLVHQKGVIRTDNFLISSIEEAIVDSVANLKNNAGYMNISEVVNDFLKLVDVLDNTASGRSVVIAGPNQSPLVHSLVFYINFIIKSPISYYEHPFSSFDFIGEGGVNSLSRLSNDIESQKIKTLFVLGGDPVFNAPNDFNFDKIYGSLSTVYLGENSNETAKKSNWVIPDQHYLETWSDRVSIIGNLSLVQPLISPLSESSISKIELLSLLLGEDKKDIDWVKENHLKINWKKSLHNGVILGEKGFDLEKSGIPPIHVNSFVSRNLDKIKRSRNTVEISFDTDYSIFDGSFIDNAWLQELPDPISKLTWDNAIIVSHNFAKENNLKSYDVVKLYSDQKSIEGSIWVLPGQDDQTITLKLGYGSKGDGSVGGKSGFNAYSLRSSQNINYNNKKIRIEKTNKTYLLASVQDHWTIADEYFEGKESSNSQNGRPIFRQASVEEYKENPNFAKDMVKVTSLEEHHDKFSENKRNSMYPDNMSIFQERTLTGEYQWGMTIDLSSCTGCNACAIACQAENNIPVVGKEEVLRGREMHWIRLDRYFEGDPQNPKMVHQPVTCLQCEQAPCEQVCPVAATVHSDEGLNDMVYNRCIGTRYCSNNCPVKVRRFNYFDYHQRSPHAKKRVSSHIFELFKEPAENLQLQFNPDVTVRMRGMMEKCTYCIQRINQVRIKSKNEERKIKDGEIVTACQQVCPTNSIVFGNIKDSDSQVSKNKRLDRDYHLLAELNIKPRTSYLASINNPNARIEKV